MIQQSTTNNPISWRKNNRDVAMKLAADVQNKLKNKVLVRIDKKTCVYVNKGEEVKYINNVTGPSVKVKNCAVWCNGKVYATVRDAAAAIGSNYSNLYKKLKGIQPNTEKINVRWATRSESMSIMM